MSDTPQPPKHSASPLHEYAKIGEGDTGAMHRDYTGKFRAFEPTEEHRTLVKGFAAVGLPQDQIASYIGIDKTTLIRHFRKELDHGMIEANSQVAKVLYQKAISGNIAAAIFWAKVRMGWSEKVVHVNDPDNPMPTQVHRIELVAAQPVKNDNSEN